jgi:hypothetical protein
VLIANSIAGNLATQSVWLGLIITLSIWMIIQFALSVAPCDSRWYVLDICWFRTHS